MERDTAIYEKRHYMFWYRMLSKIKYLMEKKKIQNNVQTICNI